MKKIIPFLIITSAILLCFASCKKSTDNLNRQEANDKGKILSELRAISLDNSNTTQAKTTSDVFNFQNDNNPFEWVGEAHNDCLDYLAQYMDELVDTTDSMSISIKQPYSSDVINVSAITTKDKIVALSEKFFNENIASSHTQDDGVDINTENENNQSIINYFENNQYVYPQVSGLNAYNENIWLKLTYFAEEGYLTDFESHADSIVISKIMETDDVQSSLDIIKSSETVILNSSLGETEKNNQLIFLAILRNSIGYWANVIQDTNNPWWQLNVRIWNITGTHEGYAKITPLFHWSWHNFWGALCAGAADALGGAGAGLLTSNPVLIGLAGAGCSAVVTALWP